MLYRGARGRVSTTAAAAPGCLNYTKPLSSELTFANVYQTTPPTADLTGTPYSMFANSKGLYEFTVPIEGAASREPWYVGVQGLVPVFGVDALNFTLAVSPMIENDVQFPGRTTAVGERAVGDGGARRVDVVELFEDVSVTGSVRIGRFAFFRIRMLRSLRSLEVRVTEERYSGGLRIFTQEGVPPSLTAHHTVNVTRSTAVGAGKEGYYYKVPAYGSKDVWIGVYGFSYDFQSDMRTAVYRFSITASTVMRPSGLGEVKLISLSTNYRFATRTNAAAGQYVYYEIQHSFANRDLHVEIKVSFGSVDMVVSNVQKQPMRALIDVGWKSLASEGTQTGIKDGVNIYTYDPGFKPGLFYVGIYPHTQTDFSIAAYTDLTSFGLELGKAYRIRALTYSYRYFRFNVTKVYNRLTIVFREETSGLYMTAAFMQGEKPSDSINLFLSAVPDEKGDIRTTLNNPEFGEYYLKVHFYKSGYAGQVLQHTYTMDIQADDYDPPGYKSLEHELEFQVIRDQRYEQASVPRPPKWDEVRPSVAWKVATLELGRPQTAAFYGEEWLYYSVYVSTFSSNLTVVARPLTQGLALTLVVRRAEKPTLVTYIDKDETANSNGEYTVRAPSPVTGGLYYIGLYGAAAVLEMKASRVVLVASVDPGIAVLPTMKILINYFVSFDTVPALSYRYYKIYLPADERDLSIQVTHLVGETDIVISNVNPWPTKSNYNASAVGWWKTESAVGGGKQIVISNYERGYKSPSTYYIGVFASSFTSYFVLARLDRPPPTIPISSEFRSQVAVSAFSTFRFQLDGLIVSRVVFIVRQQRPFSTGLALYAKRSSVPTLLDYEFRTTASTSNGEYFLFIERPNPDEIFYLGVFGKDQDQLLERGKNFYFLGQIQSQDGFELYESTPFLQDPVEVAPPGNYIPPKPSTYSILSPDTPLMSSLLNNGTFKMFRLQVSEFTRVTADAGNNDTLTHADTASRHTVLPPHLLLAPLRVCAALLADHCLVSCFIF